MFIDLSINDYIIFIHYILQYNYKGINYKNIHSFFKLYNLTKLNNIDCKFIIEIILLY